MNSFHAFIFGLSLPFRAFRLVAQTPRLLAASVLPWILSAGLDAWLIHRTQSALAAWIHSHAPAALEWIALALAWIAVLIAGVLLFSFIAGIAALPFNDWLAELTESHTVPALPRVPRVSGWGRARLLSIDLFKTLCALGMSGVALVLSWLPGLNLLGAVLAFLLIAFQFLSYPQTRRGEGLWGGIRFLTANFPACLGFGMSFALLFAVPVISSFSLPLAVVGGTLLYAYGAARSLPLPSS